MQLSKPSIQKINFFDREDLRNKTFWPEYENYAQNRNQIKILNFYGKGGVGKTALIGKIRTELNTSRAQNKNPIASVYVDLETVDGIIAFLDKVRNQLQGNKNFDFQFPRYDLLRFALHSTLGEQSPLEEKRALLKTSRFLRKCIAKFAPSVEMSKDLADFYSGLSKSDLADFISEKFNFAWDSANDFLTKMGVSNLVMKVNQLQQNFGLSLDIVDCLPIVKNLAAVIQENSLNYDLKEVIAFNSVFEEYEEQLVHCFATDLNENTDKLKSPLVFFIDKYEHIEKKTHLGFEKCLSINKGLLEYPNALLENCRNILWVISGRKKIDWGKDREEIISYVPVEDFTLQDTVQMLEQAGIKDDLKFYLAKLTSGTPTYLRTCIRMFQSGRHLNKSDYGENVNDLLSLYFSDFPEGTLKVASQLAALRIWDDAFLKEIRPDFFKPNPLDFEYQKIKELPCIKKINDKYEFDQTIAIGISKYCPETIRHEILMHARQYYLLKFLKTEKLLAGKASGLQRWKLHEELDIYRDAFCDYALRLVNSPEELESLYDFFVLICCGGNGFVYEKQIPINILDKFAESPYLMAGSRIYARIWLPLVSRKYLLNNSGNQKAVYEKVAFDSIDIFRTTEISVLTRLGNFRNLFNCSVVTLNDCGPEEFWLAYSIKDGAFEDFDNFRALWQTEETKTELTAVVQRFEKQFEPIDQKVMFQHKYDECSLLQKIALLVAQPRLWGKYTKKGKTTIEEIANAALPKDYKYLNCFPFLETCSKDELKASLEVLMRILERWAERDRPFLALLMAREVYHIFEHYYEEENKDLQRAKNILIWAGNSFSIDFLSVASPPLKMGRSQS